jgi:hypothetical protein
MVQKVSLILLLLLICAPVLPQTSESDSALMVKARSLYDAPFTRNLAAFDCEVQFDWKAHFAAMLGTMPPAAVVSAEHLQTIHHRISLDGHKATVSSKPEKPDFTGVPQESQLEQVLIAMVSSGLNAWLPSSTNVVLPVGTTKYQFEKLPSGFSVAMNGDDVKGTLLLDSGFRVTSGAMDLPQAMSFATEFKSGPQGYVLSSIRTGPAPNDAAFAYTYQSVDGFQLPAEITVNPATTGKWQYQLNDCKVVKFVKLQVGLPKQ